jgi:hypothetical protein
MNRIIRIVATLNAILFSFVVPFSIVYLRQVEMYSKNAEIAILYAAENAEQVDAALARAKVVEKSVPHEKAAPTQTSSPRAYWSSRIVKVDAEEAAYVLPLIAQCESGNNPVARNPHSSAKGWLQIIDGTWDAFGCTGDVLNKDDNFACGMKIATKSGLHHWDPSRHCWSKKLQGRDI